MSPETAVAIARWRARGVDEAAAAFARSVVSSAAPVSPVRARSLLWATSRCGAWAASVGLELVAAVVLHHSVIERYVIVGMDGASAPARRTARTNLRFVATRVSVAQPPLPRSLRRNRAKAPYSPPEIDAWFALAAAQPTEARRSQLVGLLCLGLGAGLEGGELRGVAGGDVVARSGGVVVAVGGRRARVVPVAGAYHRRLLASAAFAGDGFVCGGVSPTRRNVTTDLVSRLSGGGDLGRLDVGRLRSTWLTTHLVVLGLDALFAAAGVVCSQRLGDLAAQLPRLDEASLVSVLGR